MIIKEEGKKTRYYYYKKKVGRKKKRGPKKKKIPKVKQNVHWDYKIIITSSKKQIEYVDKYYSLEKALEALNNLEKENNKVIFPKAYLNFVKIIPANYEYVLLKKNRDGNEENRYLRNEYGKLIEISIDNNEKWVVYDRRSKLVEETFWVYGYHPRTQRKDFTWIYNNLIIGKLFEPYDIIRVVVFRNKVIFKYDSNDIEFVSCKTETDAIKMYNLIEEWVKKRKNRQVFFMGTCNKISDFRKTIINDLIKKTNWPMKKIIRNSTRA